jgi:hypothetical protein
MRLATNGLSSCPTFEQQFARRVLLFPKLMGFQRNADIPCRSCSLPFIAIAPTNVTVVQKGSGHWERVQIEMKEQNRWPTNEDDSRAAAASDHFVGLGQSRSWINDLYSSDFFILPRNDRENINLSVVVRIVWTKARQRAAHTFQGPSVSASGGWCKPPRTRWERPLEFQFFR